MTELTPAEAFFWKTIQDLPPKEKALLLAKIDNDEA